MKQKDVSQVVIKRGFLDTRKKNSPIFIFDHVTENRIILHEQVSNMDVILDFEEMHFLPYDFETEGKESKQKISGHYL